MAHLAGRGMETEEVTFKDAEGDDVGFRAEVMGGRGRVALLCGGVPHPQIPYIRQLVYATSESKLYINGHEATIPLPAGGDAELLARIEEVAKKGKISWGSAETVDAAAELAKVQEDEADELAADGLTPEQIARLQTTQAKKRGGKKKVPQESLDQLIAMGYTEPRARRALALCDGTTAEVALQWLEQHQTDADIDDPVPPEKEPEWVKPLTEEEKKEKLKQLEELAQVKKKQRQEEEQRAAIQREKKRREEGQSLQEIREEHERQARLKAYEEKRREKEAVLKAKAEVRAKMNADRIAKGWAPLPDPEEERKKKAEKSGGGGGGGTLSTEAAIAELMGSGGKTAAADDDWDPWGGRAPGQAGGYAGAAPAAPAAAAAPVSRPARPLPGADGMPLPGKGLTPEILAEAVRRVKAQNSESDAQRCLLTLKTYASNAIAHPTDTKFRSISLSSKGYESRVGCIEGGVEVLFLLGFRPRGTPPKDLFLTSLHIPTVASAVQLLQQ